MSIKISKTFQPHSVVMGTVTHGADIMETLETYCQENGIQTAWFNVMGALSKITLAYYEQEGHTYVSKSFTGEYEILNGTGNISLKNGEPITHLHMTLSDTAYTSFGGHVMKGSTQVFACEFALFVLDGATPLVREDGDPDTGLSLWTH